MSMLAILGVATMLVQAPLAAGPVLAGTATQKAAPPVVLVQAGDCYAIGEAVANQNGGTLASASEAQQNGAAVCQIIVVIPGQNGERPKRMEIIVPKG